MKTVVNHVLILELNSKDTVGIEMLQSQVRAGAGTPRKIRWCVLPASQNPYPPVLTLFQAELRGLNFPTLFKNWSKFLYPIYCMTWSLYFYSSKSPGARAWPDRLTSRCDPWQSSVFCKTFLIIAVVHTRPVQRKKNKEKLPQVKKSTNAIPCILFIMLKRGSFPASDSNHFLKKNNSPPTPLP